MKQQWYKSSINLFVLTRQLCSRGPQIFLIMSMALGITWIHYWNQGSQQRLLNQESQFLHIFLDTYIKMNHMMHKPLFSKQESQKSIQESWNQAWPKILKIPESHQQISEMQMPRLCSRLIRAHFNTEQEQFLFKPAFHTSAFSSGLLIHCDKQNLVPLHRMEVRTAITWLSSSYQ